MVSAPSAIAVTTPTLFTVAATLLLALHTPPAVVSVSVVVIPGDMALMPEIAPMAVAAFTVTGKVIESAAQKLLTLYFMFATPAEIPDTIPVTAFTEAIPGASLVHTPPEFPSVVKLME